MSLQLTALLLCWITWFYTDYFFYIYRVSSCSLAVLVSVLLLYDFYSGITRKEALWEMLTLPNTLSLWSWLKLVILIVRWTDWWSSFTSSWSCKVYSFQIRISWPSHLVTPWTTWAFRQSIYLWYSWAWCVHSSCFGGKTISVVRVKKNVWCFYCQDWVC